MPYTSAPPDPSTTACTDSGVMSGRLATSGISTVGTVGIVGGVFSAPVELNIRTDDADVRCKRANDVTDCPLAVREGKLRSEAERTRRANIIEHAHYIVTTTTLTSQITAQLPGFIQNAE